MKKRIALLTLAIMMALSVTSVAMADEIPYTVKINSNIFSGNLRKINDTRAVDNNTYCYRTSTSYGTSYQSAVWKNQNTRLSTVYSISSGGYKSWTLAKRDDGNIQLKLVNPQSYKITIHGKFLLYAS